MDYQDFKKKLFDGPNKKRNYLLIAFAVIVPGSAIMLPAYFFCIKPLLNRYKLCVGKK